MSMTFWNLLISPQNFKELQMKIVLIVVLVIALIILSPIATIWALNTLFPVLAIPYAFDTWLASCILGGLISSSAFSSKK